MAALRLHCARLLYALLLACCLWPVVARAQGCALEAGAVHAARETPGSTQRPTQGWEAVTLPDTWTRRWPEHSGAAWYRIQLRRDCSADQASREPHGLVVKSINMAGEIYLNDTLLWRDASLQEPMSRSWNMPRHWILPDAALHASGNALWIRIQGRALITPGLGLVSIGPAPEMLALKERYWWAYRTIFVINVVATLCIAGLFAGIWLLYRREALHGWFALTNLAWVVFIYNIVATDPWPFGDTVGVVRANAIAFLLFCTCYAIFIFQLRGRALARRLERGLLAMTACLSLLILAVPEKHLPAVMLPVVALHFLVFGLACMAPLLHLRHSRKLEDILHALLGVAFLAIAAYDGTIFYLDAPWQLVLTPYANLLTMIGITSVLGSRIAAGMRRAERFNVELTQAVEDACRELESTLDKEHQLELSNSRLRERLQFIHDLHDGFGSALVRAIVQAERNAEEQADTSRHVSTLKSLRDDLRNVMDGGRNASAHAPATPAEWLTPTRHRFSTLFDELEMDSRWSFPAAWPWTPSVALCLELTRLLEEALSNVLKHSRATRVEITLTTAAHRGLALEVRDNGVGFDAASRDGTGGIGLCSMQARATRLGGHLHIESRPGHSLLRTCVARCAVGRV